MPPYEFHLPTPLPTITLPFIASVTPQEDYNENPDHDVNFNPDSDVVSSILLSDIQVLLKH